MLRAMRFSPLLLMLLAAPAWAVPVMGPNKPGKKPEAPIVVGARAAERAPQSAPLLGFGGAPGGGGDLGFAAPSSPRAGGPALGYRGTRAMGNKPRL